MAFRRRSRARRPRKSYMWTGHNQLSFSQGTTDTHIVVFDPAVYPQTMAGHLVVVRVEISLTWIGTTATAAQFGAYLMDFGTEETETVLTGMPWTFMTQDIEIAEKRMLWTVGGRAPVAGQTPLLTRDTVKSKRVLDNAKALFMVVDGSNATNTINVSGVVRCLIQVGR